MVEYQYHVEADVNPLICSPHPLWKSGSRIIIFLVGPVPGTDFQPPGEYDILIPLCNCWKYILFTFFFFHKMCNYLCFEDTINFYSRVEETRSRPHSPLLETTLFCLHPPSNLNSSKKYRFLSSALGRRFSKSGYIYSLDCTLWCRQHHPNVTISC